LGNGEKIQFWTDWWIGDGPLSQRFTILFQISAEPDGYVHQLWRNGSCNINFRRTFGQEERDSWAEFMLELDSIPHSAEQDSVSWAFEPLGQFSTKSLYSKMMEGVAVDYAKDIWKIVCPLKVRIFLW
jgi:hypothetical protein